MQVQFNENIYDIYQCPPNPGFTSINFRLLTHMFYCGSYVRGYTNTMILKYIFYYIDCKTDPCDGGAKLDATVSTQSLTSTGFGK